MKRTLMSEEYYDKFQQMLTEAREHKHEARALYLREFDARIHEIDPILAVEEEERWWADRRARIRRERWPA